MGIFRDITKSLKKAAPVIGAGIGMYFGGAAGAAIGSGLASSATGRSTEESLRNAALAGGTAYAIGGAGSMGGGTENFNTANSPLRGLFADTSVADTAIKSNTGGSTGIMGALTKNPLLTASLAASALPLFMGQDKSQEEEENKMDPYATGKSRLGVGSVGDKSYNLDDDEERKDYFEAVRKRQGIDTLNANAGGEVKGPGTGTSDSVPARLSDGEFVVTADAVRGAGGGDRDVGAARMYDMMSQLERAA